MDRNQSIADVQRMYRNQSIADIQRMYSYFSKKKNEYARYQYECSHTIKAVGQFSYLGCIIVCAVTAGIVYLAFEEYFVSMFTAYRHIAEAVNITLSCVLLPVVQFLCMFNADKKAIEQYNNKVTDRNALIKQLKDELINYYKACPNCCISYEFSNPTMIATLWQYLNQGRADSIKEAINLYYADIHNRNMENAQKELRNSIDRSNREIIARLDNIDKNTYYR